MSFRTAVLSLSIIILAYLAGRIFIYKPDSIPTPDQSAIERSIQTPQGGTILTPMATATATDSLTPLPSLSASPSAGTRTPSPNGIASHIVIKGDTLYSISSRYGITTDALKKANNLTGDDIYLGQALVIPKPGS